MWRWDLSLSLSLSHGDPLQGRWRADNPSVQVERLQSYRQTSAVDSCYGALSMGQHCEIWQCWSLPMSSILEYLTTCYYFMAATFHPARLAQDFHFFFFFFNINSYGGVCFLNITKRKFRPKTFMFKSPRFPPLFKVKACFVFCLKVIAICTLKCLKTTWLLSNRSVIDFLELEGEEKLYKCYF